MKSDLDLLIAEYAREKSKLQEQVDECLQQGHYLEADLLSRALQNVNEELRTLTNLENRNYDEIERLKSRIALYEERLTGKSNWSESAYDQFYERKLQQMRAELEVLKVESEEFHLDSQVIYDLLMDMCKGNTRGFKMQLIKKANFYLRVSLLQASTLELAFTPSQQLNDAYLLNTREKAKLKIIGFHENDGSFTMQVLNFHVAKANSVIEVLARVVFEAFYFKIFDKVVNIEVG